MRTTLSSSATAFVLLFALALTVGGQEAAKPVELDATDKAGLEAAANKDVVITGTVKRARWSGTGKVMNVDFEDSPLIAAVFEKNKDAINAAFGGDAAKKWTGARVKLKGKLGKYNGPVETMADRPQIVVTKADQVSVVEAAKAGEKKE